MTDEFKRLIGADAVAPTPSVFGSGTYKQIITMDTLKEHVEDSLTMLNPRPRPLNASVRWPRRAIVCVHGNYDAATSIASQLVPRGTQKQPLVAHVQFFTVDAADKYFAQRMTFWRQRLVYALIAAIIALVAARILDVVTLVVAAALTAVTFHQHYTAPTPAAQPTLRHLMPAAVPPAAQPVAQATSIDEYVVLYGCSQQFLPPPNDLLKMQYALVYHIGSW